MILGRARYCSWPNRSAKILITKIGKTDNVKSVPDDITALFGDNMPMHTQNAIIKIGVLGGIGPEATGEFYTKLITRLQYHGLIKSNRDFPQIVVNSIPAPELIFDKINDTDLALYASGLKELDTFGVDFIVMVCNTIHLYYDQLQAQIKTPIVDLRVEVCKILNDSGIKSILVLGTPNTISKGLYDFDGITSIKPTKEEIKVLSNSIFNFNRGIDKEKQNRAVASICEKYLKIGAARTVILGCTEFGLMLHKYEFDKVNTIDVLVNATIEKFKALKS